MIDGWQYIETTYTDNKFAQHSLRAALKKGVEAGKLIKVKASYKLAESEKKVNAPSSFGASFCDLNMRNGPPPASPAPADPLLELQPCLPDPLSPPLTLCLLCRCYAAPPPRLSSP